MMSWRANSRPNSSTPIALAVLRRSAPRPSPSRPTPARYSALPRTALVTPAWPSAAADVLAGQDRLSRQERREQGRDAQRQRGQRVDGGLAPQDRQAFRHGREGCPDDSGRVLVADQQHAEHADGELGQVDAGQGLIAVGSNELTAACPCGGLAARSRQ